MPQRRKPAAPQHPDNLDGTMSRGRGQRITTASRSAPAISQGETKRWADEAFEAALLSLPPGCEQEAQRVIADPRRSPYTSDWAESDLSDAPEPHTSGRRWMLAATWVLAGAGDGAVARAASLLGEAERQQRYRISVLSRLHHDPMSQQAFTVLLDCARPDDADFDMRSHLLQCTEKMRKDHLFEVREEARRVLGEIQRSVAFLRENPQPERWLRAPRGTLDSNVREIRRQRLCRALIPALVEALDANDRHRVRALCDRVLGTPQSGAPVGMPSEETLEQARLLVGSLDLLWQREEDIFDHIMAGDQGPLPTLIDDLRSSRRSGGRPWGGPGDAVGPELWSSEEDLERMPWLSRMPEAADAASARAQVHGILRSLDLFAGPLDALGHSYQVNVAVSPQAMKELMAEGAGLEIRRGVQASPIKREEQREGARPDLPETDPDQLATFAVARQRLRIGQRQIEVRYLHRLASESLADPDAHGRSKSRFESEASAIVPDHPRMSSVPVHLPDELFSVVSSLPFPSGVRGSRLREGAGADDCSHHGAIWRATGHGKETARLTCPRCLRLAIRSVPMHRLPDEVMVDGQTVAERLADPTPYLRLERLHRRIAGDEAEFSSVSELRERDGLLDPRGSAHPSEGDSTGARSPVSVRAAMNRR